MKDGNIVIDSSNVDRARMSDWGNSFWEIYKKHDRRRSLADIWLMVNEEAAQTCNGIRVRNYELISRSLSHTFCWILSFVNKIVKDEGLKNEAVRERFRGEKPPTVEEIVFHKYPNRCLSCGCSKCLCPVLEAKLKLKDEQTQEWRQAAKPAILNEWEGMFDGIYSLAHRNYSFNEIGFHFAEEVGEVSECIRILQECDKQDIQECRTKLYDEIADAISWCFSIVKRLHEIVQRSNKILKLMGNGTDESEVRLSKLLWNEYKSEDGSCIVCHKCRNRKAPGHPQSPRMPTCQCGPQIIRV